MVKNKFPRSLQKMSGSQYKAEKRINKNRVTSVAQWMSRSGSWKKELLRYLHGFVRPIRWLISISSLVDFNPSIHQYTGYIFFLLVSFWCAESPERVLRQSVTKIRHNNSSQKMRIYHLIVWNTYRHIQNFDLFKLMYLFWYSEQTRYIIGSFALLKNSF